jgi:hypothetical protein
MAYEAKPGQFSLFPNDRKASPSQPDYKGDGKDLEGNDVWVSAWLKDGAKGAFMSCSMQRKDSQGSAPSSSAPATKPAAKPAPKAAPNFSDMDDDLPF